MFLNVFIFSKQNSDKILKVTLDKKPRCRYNITNVLKHGLYNDFGAIRIALHDTRRLTVQPTANLRIDGNGETCHPNRNLRKNI